jgi:CBS domain-containing protein
MICPTCGVTNLPGAELCKWCMLELAALDRPQPFDRVDGSLMTDSVAVLDPRPPICVPITATIGAAVAKMMSKKVGALLVTNANDQLVGILTERDFLTRVAGHADFAQRPVRDYMTRDPETVAPSDPLGFALAKMDRGGYRHLPVVEGDFPVGMISARDVLRHLLNLCQEPGGI